jgi:PD-(D/E)XK nuclease superfamily
MAVRYRSSAGSALISVTQVLTLANRIDASWFTPESAWRGQVVHALTEAFDRHEALVIPVGLEGYLDAYAAFVRSVKPVYGGSEVQVTNDVLRLGGRIDRVCVDVFGRPGLLDLKTGAPSAWHGQQLSAYNVLRPTGNRWALYLRPDGRYRLTAYTDPLDHRRFMFDLAQTRGTVLADGDHWVAAA